MNHSKFDFTNEEKKVRIQTFPKELFKQSVLELVK